MRRRQVLLGVFTLLTAGCNDPVSCTQIVRYGITITVTDSATGAALGGNETEVVLTARDYTEVVPAAGWNIHEGARERAGIYAVRVSRSGYAEWVRTGVRVHATTCHVVTVRLHARLQQLSP